MSGISRCAVFAFIAAVVTGAMAPGSARADIMVDDFTQKIGPVWPQVQSTSTAGGVPEMEIGLAADLGGTRGYVVKNATIGAAGLDDIISNVFDGPGISVFDYQSSIGASGTVELFYGDAATNPLAEAGVTGLNIALTGFDNASGGPLQILVRWTERTGPSTSITANALATVSTPGAQLVNVPNALPAGTTVDKITIDFIAPAGTDFRVDSVSMVTVPEPASIGMLGLGGLLLLRRRGNTAVKPAG